jgi:hypothetical protein
MNASFRTAFWAMCLGLSVPMVLFVGVELTSGGRVPRKSMAAAEQTGSRAKREAAQPGSTPRDLRNPNTAQIPSDTSSPKLAGDKSSSDGADNLVARDPADAKVFLDPEIEPETAPSEGGGGHDRRIPAFVARRQQKRDTIPKPEPTGLATSMIGAEIDARLAGIQSHLDDLGREIARQGQREPPGDPLKQTAEILRQLRDARELERLADRSVAQSTPDSDDLHEASLEELPPFPDEIEPQPLPPAESAEPAKPRRTLTRIYRPRFIGSQSLKALVEPLLTEGVGKAGASGAGGEDDGADGGTEALVVRDFPEALRKIDRLVQKVDLPPVKVILEATVVTVSLPPGMPNGIDLLALKGSGHAFSISPVESASGADPKLPIPVGMSPRVLTHGFGLKCGVLSGDPRALLGSIQARAPTRRTSAWQMTVLNRQSAELMLSDPFGADCGNDCAVGTLLKIRPVAGRDGSLRLDVRREIDLEANAVGGRAAALTYQFVLKEGQTAIVAGFLAEQAMTQESRSPGSGELPRAGGPSRKQTEFVEKTETLVLLTPHVVGSPVKSEPPSARKEKLHSRKSTGTGGSKAAASRRKSPEASKPRASLRPAAAETEPSSQVAAPESPQPQTSPRKLSPVEAKPIPLSGAEEMPAAPKTRQSSADDLDSIPPLVLPDDQPRIRPAPRSIRR